MLQCQDVKCKTVAIFYLVIVQIPFYNTHKKTRFIANDNVDLRLQSLSDNSLNSLRHLESGQDELRHIRQIALLAGLYRYF